MKNTIFKSVLIAVGLVVLGIFLINTIILPVKAKSVIINLFEENLGRKVEIKTLRYIPFTNLSMGNAVIYNDRAGTDKILNIEKAGFKFSLFPLLLQKKLVSRLDLRNAATQSAKISGSVRTSLASDALSPSKLKGTVRFVDLSVRSGLIPYSVEQFNGMIDFERDGISLNDSYFNFKGTNYQLDGGIRNLEEIPNAYFTLGSNGNGLISEGNLLLKDGYISIEKLNATIANSTVNIIGDINNLRDPIFNLYGESRVNAADIGYLFPEKREKLKLGGGCDVALFFRGRPSEIEEAEFGLKVKSDKLSAKGFDFKDFDVDLRMKNGLLTTPKLRAGFYEGIIEGGLNAEPFSRGKPYSMEMVIQNASLARWAKDVKSTMKISGNLSSRFLVKGYGNDIDNLKGRGWVTVTDGYLWEIPLLGDMANLLSLTNLKSVVFKEAAGNFSIENREIRIEELMFYSDDVNISIKGSIDFDSNLDLLVTTNITQNLIEDDSEAAQIANILIQQAGQLLGTIRITGNLKDPKYNTKAPKATKPVEKIFKSSIGNILKDILE